MRWFSNIMDRINNWGKKAPMENPGLVEQKRQELNNLTPGQNWIIIRDYVALVNFQFMLNQANQNSKTAVFNPAAGYPVKAFLNSATGELRLFSIELFER